jgi:hypothetical protein
MKVIIPGRAVPGRLLERGFVVAYPEWVQAARDLCRESAPMRRRRVAA